MYIGKARMTQQGARVNQTNIGVKFLGLGAGRKQVAFIASASQASNTRKVITKAKLSKRAGLYANHYTRFVEAINSKVADHGFSKITYDDDSKVVTSAPKLYDGKETFVKVPSYYLQQGLIGNQSMLILLFLSRSTYQTKDE